MFKKFSLLLLALVLVASLVACGSDPGPTPEEVAFDTYSQIMQRLSFDG